MIQYTLGFITESNVKRGPGVNTSKLLASSKKKQGPLFKKLFFYPLLSNNGSSE